MTALKDDLKFYYAFEEATGNPVDSTGLTTAVVSGCTQNQTGKIGKCFSFDGTNDNVLTNLSFDTPPVTINVWVYSNYDGTSQRNIVGNDNGGYDFGLVEYTSGSLYYDVFYGNGRVGTYEAGITGEWVMLTVVIESGSNTIYVNGSYAGTDAHGTNSSGGFWEIGAQGNAANYFYKGLIDECALWERALSEAEITALWNSGDGLAYPFAVTYTKDVTGNASLASFTKDVSGNASLYKDGELAWYAFEDNYEDSALSNDLTAQGSGNSFVTGKVGTKALNTDGNGYANDTSVSGISTGNFDFGLCLWYKPDAQPSLDTKQDLVSIGANEATRDSLGLAYENDGGTYKLTFTTFNDDVKVTQTLDNGTWYWLLANYTASTHTVEFFVNNVSIGTQVLSGDLNIDSDKIYVASSYEV